jgi:ribosomal protein L16/L10AE
VRPGRILFEITTADPEVAKAALNRARYKLGFKTKVVAREVLGEGS